MCGIAGTYAQTDEPLVRTMLSREGHRGPDDAGVVPLEGGTLGHARLSIIDVTGGHQPLANEDGTIWLVLNGEIYNHEDLRRRLTHHRFTTRTDAEVIVHLYEDVGPACIEELDGMFALALYDGAELLLARDPLGIKPLYYGCSGETLCFASEIKALRTATDDIREFPQGHWFHTRSGWGRYFDLRALAHADRTVEEPVRAVRDRLVESIRKRLMSDVPLGVFLSGGLDSSILAAVAKESIPRLDTFSIGVEGSEDLQRAQEMADYLDTNHHERRVTKDDLVEALPEVIYHLESYDAALVRSAVPNYFLAKLASDHVKVVLCGEGADELYSGYEYLKEFEGADLHRELYEITDELHNTNLQRVDRMTMAHSLEGRVPFLDVDHMRTAFALPTDLKLHGDDKTEKWVLRQAFSHMLPRQVAWRAKAKFSEGCGTSDLLRQHAERTLSDAAFEQERHLPNGDSLGRKEELLYYRHARDHFGEALLGNVGRSRSL